jgi:D-glycero-D-manno-heptose 1,7-bisphosphate phosphatase
MQVVSLSKPLSNILVLFDRDGTLNEDSGYESKRERLKLTAFGENIKPIFREFIFSAAIVSNQSGIGRGYHTAQDFIDFSDAVIRIIDPNLDHFFCLVFCEHLPEEICKCRKPNTEMLTEVIKMGNFPSVLFVGNADSDAKAAENVGIDYLDSKSKEAHLGLKNWLRPKNDH